MAEVSFVGGEPPVRSPATYTLVLDEEEARYVVAVLGKGFGRLRDVGRQLDPYFPLFDALEEAGVLLADLDLDGEQTSVDG